MVIYTCELCGGHQFAKSGEYFVCQQCGIQYGVAEMKRLVVTSSDGNADTNENQQHGEEINQSQRRPAPSMDADRPVQQRRPAPGMDEDRPVQQRRPAPGMNTERPVQAKASPSRNARTEAPQKKSTVTGSKSNQVKSGGGKAKDKEANPKKKKLIHILLVAAAIFVVIYFIVALVQAMDTSSNVGNNKLITSGIIELLLAIILYKIMMHQIRYNCPKCAGKRVHHRRFVRTTEVDKDYNGQGSKTIYTHHYVDTYVCPSCGETRTERITKRGGEYTIMSTGSVRDTRRAPQEF